MTVKFRNEKDNLIKMMSGTKLVNDGDGWVVFQHENADGYIPTYRWDKKFWEIVEIY